jgi:monofunctional biosynthetic peptidoglycan transglycosylase
MPTTFAAPLLVDFSSPDVMRTFQVINDGVMGGLSKSRLSLASGSMSFEGEVSLENNGGFASFRGPVSFPADSTVLLLTVRGDGRRYKLTLKLDDGARTAQYQAAFVASLEWKTLRFLSTDFQASFRGRAVGAPPVRFVDVRFIGLLISDKQSGPFKTELREIRTEAKGSKTGM